MEKAGGPTSGALEDSVCQLEGGSWAMATSCGMAAITQVFFGLLKPGDRIVAHRSLYAGTNMWLDEDLPDQWCIDVERVDMRNVVALKKILEK